MKYKFWDVSRDRKKKPITLSDRILVLVAAAMAVVMLVLTGVLYSKAPDIVPTHFNFSGEGDGWEGKGFYWILAAIMLVGMIICASAAYNRKLVNLPIRLKPEVFYRQIGLISRMCRIMTIVLGFIWLAVLLAMSASFIGMSESVGVALIPLSVMLMLGVVFKKASGPKPNEDKVKNKAKKKTYITGLHGSGAAKMKAEIRRKRANRHKGK